MTNTDSLQKKARQIRATCVQLAHDGRIGHLGSALSCVEGLVALYYHWLNVSPENPKDPLRDRFILSKGHACTALYAVLADRGFIPTDWLRLYGQPGGPLAAHPCKHALPLLDFSAGSLAHGLGVAAGMLYGLRLSGSPARAAVVLGDGECNEGSTWEGATFAAAQNLEHLVALVDWNGWESVGRSDVLQGQASLEEKFRAFGWGACTVPGNDVDAVMAALDRHPLRPGRPTAIVLRTKKGAGISFMEDQIVWHYRIPSDEDLANALRELGEMPLHMQGDYR